LRTFPENAETGEMTVQVFSMNEPDVVPPDKEESPKGGRGLKYSPTFSTEILVSPETR
jgi:hypothetical protein